MIDLLPLTPIHMKGMDAMRSEYHLNHPETGDVIVIDRMTARDARKRNEALGAMRLPYRWELSIVTLPPIPRSADVRECVAA